MVRIETIKFEAAHGHKPRQSREYQATTWAFRIDSDPTPVFITGTYKDAVKQAKAMAQYRITVLP